MLHVALLIALLAPTATKTWYGPATASFDTQFAGNPYDPVTNDVRVRFTSPDGKKVERLAYYAEGGWQADLVADSPGDYTPVLVRNGVELPDAPCVQSRILLEDKLDHGYAHPDPNYPNRFLLDDGSPFIPVGHDLDWPTPGKLSTEDQLVKMGENGLTWTRFFTAAWARRDPWWPVADPDALPDELWPPALNAVGSVQHACDLNGVSYQLVLFNYQSFSSDSANGWAKNPWNVANGGFLKSAADVFSDPEAKRRAKMWLRYAVARYGSDPNLMAFELFDDVEKTDAARDGRWNAIATWVTAMTAYVRSLDPYDHMITISSSFKHADIWKSLDYYQPHLVSADPAAAMANVALPSDRPAFYGEFETAGSPITRSALRNALYTGLLANSGGLPMFGGWDEIAADNLYPELKTAAKVVRDSDIGHHPIAARLTLSVVSCSARGIGSSDWALVRVVATGVPPFSVKLGGLSTVEGACTVEVIDLDTGVGRSSTMTLHDARLELDLPGRDCVVVVTRQ